MNTKKIVRTCKLVAVGLFVTNEVIKVSTNTIKLKRQLALQEYEDINLDIKYKNLELTTPKDIQNRIDKRNKKTK